MGLLRYALKRILLIIPTLFGLTLILFTITYLLPGNPALVRLGGSPAISQLKEMEAKMGLDKPIYLRYFIYISQLLKGDLGDSWVTGRPVLVDISVRLPATVELALAGFAIMIIVGVPAGLISAIKKNTLIDHLFRAFSIGGYSIPLFWLGLIMIYFFFYYLRWAPAPIGRLDPGLSPPATITGLYILDSLITGNWATLGSSLKQIALPAITLGLANIAPVARMSRSAMLDVLNSEYIKAERAAGLPDREIYRDALRNAMIPILTVIGLNFGYMMAGSVIVEQIFSWPGIGLYALQSMAANDHDPIQAYVLIIALVFISMNLIVDILYGYIDPRIRYK
jgi:peptide/nickel transport system permease protein